MKYQKRRKYSKSGKVEWKKDSQLAQRIALLIAKTDLEFDTKHIFSFRSQGSSSRAYARIWGLSRVWQMALNKPPSYIIEVISERFDKLDRRHQDEVLVHELAHIPKNFSGALVSHSRRGPRSFHKKLKDLLTRYNNYK